MRPFLFAALLLAGAAQAADPNAVTPIGDPVAEPSSYRSIATYWKVRGDANGNARVEVRLRKTGETSWRTGLTLFRVQKGPHLGGEFGSPLTREVPLDGWLHAGSQLNVDPGAAYEVQLRLSDPDGGAAEKTLTVSTSDEPRQPEGGRTLHVVPGDGGGAGSPQNPFKGFEEADANAKAGDRMLVHAGLYPPLTATKSGEPGKPIVWQAAGDGEVLVGGAAPGPVGIRAEKLHDVWFQGLMVRKKDVGLSGIESGRIRVHRCDFQGVRSGIRADKNDKDGVRGWWITDNEIEGVTGWPPAEIELQNLPNWGIRMTGSDHVIAHNRVRRFRVGIATASSIRTANLDILANDIGDARDAAIVFDGAERNVRCMENRIVNAASGILNRTTFGGPVYLVRNVLANISGEPFPMDARPSGVLVLHNTAVRPGSALTLEGEAPIVNCVFRNNLFVGTSGEAACRIVTPMENCDVDHDGFTGGPWILFLKLPAESFPTPALAKEKSTVYKDAVLLQPSSPFAANIPIPETAGTTLDRRLDFRLEPGSGAVDAALLIPGLNDPFAGKAPDLGALEVGADLPPYGPRPASR